MRVTAEAVESAAVGIQAQRRRSFGMKKAAGIRLAARTPRPDPQLFRGLNAIRLPRRFKDSHCMPSNSGTGNWGHYFQDYVRGRRFAEGLAGGADT